MAASHDGVVLAVLSLHEGGVVRSWASDGRALPDAALDDHPLSGLDPHGAVLRLPLADAIGATPDAWGVQASEYAAAAIVLADGAQVGALAVVGTDLDAAAMQPLADLAALAALAIGAAERGVEVASLRSELQQLSATDPLTGLLNRRALHERLGAALALARRTGHPLALGVVELDGLAQVAERHGAALVDAVVLQVAHALEGAVRDHDLVARVGDASLALVWQVVEPSGAVAAAERALAALEGPFTLADPVAPRLVPIELRACAGYALYPHDAEDLAGLLRAAEVAARRAVERGAGVVSFDGGAALNER